jgi:TIR domain
MGVSIFSQNLRGSFYRTVRYLWRLQILSLTIGDDFRNEIMTELGRARAVIVIWTETSIKSDWVRSEAGRAQADRKLIPVKLEHLTYKDLPPPFDVLHTENVGEDDKIRAAVVAQLAKPAVEPTAVALLTKGFKYEVLTWVGIVGGALTLFTNLGSVLKLADWPRVLVQHWKEWTHALWVWAFGWLGIQLGPGWTPVLSFLLFGSLLAIGQAVKFKSTIKNQATEYKYQGKSFRLISWRTLLSIVAIFVLYELIDLWVDRYYPVT